MKKINLIEMQQKLRKNTSQTGWLSRVVCMLMVLFSLGVGQMWGATVTIGRTYNIPGKATSYTMSSVTNTTVTQEDGTIAMASGTMTIYEGNTSTSSVPKQVCYRNYTGSDHVKSKSTATYIGFQLVIASGYELVVSTINLAVGTTANFSYAIELLDNASPTKKSLFASSDYTMTNYNKSTVTNRTQSLSPASTLTLSGTVHARLYVWYNGTGKYIVPSAFTITGDLRTSGGGGCAATADAGADKATTYNTGVAMAAAAATSGYTGAWSIKAGSPNTSTSQLSSTSAYNATFTPSAAGNYTLVWTVTSNSDNTCTASDNATVTVSKAAMPSTGLATGTASSITATGATLPFTMTSTSGVGSLTIKVYNNSTDALVKTYSNITPTTSGSQAVTGLSASTTYYYKITPVGDANHNDGSETDKSSTFTTLSIPTHSVTAATSTGDDSKGTVSAGASTVAEGSTTTITASPAAGYKVTNWAVSGTDASINPSGTSNSNTTTLTMGTADATVTVTFGDASYGVTYVGSGRSKTTGGSSATHGTDFTATFTQNTYYTLRSAITVTIGGNTATQGTEYLWSISNGVGTVTIDGDYITGAIVITVNADANRYDVTLTYDDDKITKVSGSTGTNAATYYSTYTATFRAKTGYVLKDDISVTIGGNSATKGSEYSWSVSEGLGTFSVSGSNVIGAIVAEVKADVDDTDYEITYAAGAGVTLTSGNPPSPDSEHKNGESVEIQGNTGNMVYSGYTFRGWTDGTTFYRAGDHVTINGSDIALTAVWDGGTSCTEYEVLLSSGSVTQESSTKPYGQYITGRGKIMRKADGSDATSLSDGSSCHSSTKYFQTGSGVIGLQTYNAINKVTVYATATGNRTLSSIKTGTTLGTYGDDIQGSCTVKVNGSTDTPSSHITWSKDVCGEIEITFPNTLAANTYILVTFSGNLYVYGALFENCTKSNFTVSFNMKGHGSAISSYVGVPTGKKIVAPPAPEATGYTFDGWYRDNSCSNVWNWGSSTVTQDTTLYAKWTPNQYAINYYDQGGSVFSGEHSATPPTTHTYGTATTLKSATKSCYTFDGWYTNSSCTGSAVNTLSATGYTADINLYAKWTLTLDVTTEPTTPVAATVGSASSISMAATGASNYQWQICDDDEGTNATDITGSDTEYSNYTTNTLSFTPASAGTYYLRCKITDACSNNDYTRVVTVNASEAYDVEKGSYTNGSITISPTSAGAGTSISISATPDDNYVFKNWTIHKKGDASTTVTPSSSTSASTSFSMPAYDVTVNATFVATHTLTVSVSGGVGGTVSPTSTTVGETLTQSISATPSTGYNFTSWAFSGTGASLSSTTTNPTTFTMGTANATVTATFSAKTYSITLDANGGSSGSANVTMTYNSASHTAITAPTAPTGYSFAGWYTGSGGTGSMVMNASGVLQAGVTNYTGAGGIWTRTTSTTLYAKYTANYPDGYIYITDVMSTPETKAGYTITASATDAAYDGALDGGFSHSGLQHWAKASAKNTGVYTLTFSSALSASATAAGVEVDVWWGSDNGSSNAGTKVYLNGTSDADEIGYQKTDSKTRQTLLEGLKSLQKVGITSVSSIQLKCTDNAGSTWFRVGVKEIPGYLLTYDDGDGSGAPSASYQPNKTITLSNTEPTYAGHVFLGWQVNGSGTVYAAGASFSMPAEAVTLVAKWASACMQFAAATSGSSDVSAKTEKNISTASGGYASTLSGGSMTFYGRVGKIGNNDKYGLVFDSKDDELLTVTLSGAMLEAGAIIVLDCYSVNTNSTEVGFTISGNACDEGTYTTTAAENQRFTRTYVVTEDDGIDGASTFTIEGATTNKVYLKGMTVASCSSCTSITPSLSYDNTTIWVGESVATPTLNKDGSAGSVTYSSSNTEVATVDPSTGVVTAVARGTATITATIAADGTHCGKTATCVITVKNVGCGNNTIAKATRSGTSASYSGIEGGSALVSNLDGSNYKLKSGGYVGVQLPSTLSFEAGDIVRIDLTIGDWWNGASVDELPVVVYADNTGTNEIYRTDNYTKLTAQVVEFEVTSSMLTALASKQVTVYRQSSNPVTQNHVVNSVEVKRYTCPDSKEFLPTGDNGNWNATANWIGEAGRGVSLPTSSDRVVISKPVTVNVTTAAAKDILINQYSGATGKVTINSDAVLQVEGTIQKTTTGSTRVATAVNDLIIDCDKDRQGALIFEQPASGTLQTKGTVNFYTRSYRDVTSKKLQWQYVGYPFASGTDEDYDGYYINKYSESQGKWIVMRDQGDRTINAWEGLAISGDDEGGAQLQGTFAPTTNTNVSLTHGNAAGENLIGNSWTAPIQLADMDASDFGAATATVYIFNTGRFKNDGSEGSSTESGTTDHTVGQWMTIPISSAKNGVWAGMKVIPAFQAFEVITSSETTLSLDYSKVVRSATNTMNAELHAPARRGIKAAEVDGYRIRVADSLTQTDMYLFEDITFTTDFDNGWEGYYMPCDGRSAQLYAQTALGKMAVAALPDLEGTLLGFKPGKSSEYTFSFGTNAGVYYLNDIKTQTSTLMQEGYEYTFTWEDGDDTNRFIISATPFAKTTPTGVEDGSLQKVDGVQKVLYKDHMYIIRGGRVFDATGVLVK